MTNIKVSFGIVMALFHDMALWGEVETDDMDVLLLHFSLV